MTYGRSIWLAALAALLVLGSSCGDDDGGGGDDEGPGDSPSGDKDSGSGGSDDDKDASSGGGGAPPASGGSGEGGSSSSAGGTGGDVTPLDDDAGGIEVCGAKTCADPMCCADAFVSRCGVRINARACLPPAPTSTMSDERCPSVSVMNGAFNIPSCCTDDMKCGIDAAAAGMGCISLEEVRAFSSMNMADGGGANPASGIMWPEPKACN